MKKLEELSLKKQEQIKELIKKFSITGAKAGAIHGLFLIASNFVIILVDSVYVHHSKQFIVFGSLTSCILVFKSIMDFSIKETDDLQEKIKAIASSEEPEELNEKA